MSKRGKSERASHGTRVASKGQAFSVAKIYRPFDSFFGVHK